MERKELTREYKRTPRRAGLFVVHNTVSGKRLVGTTPDLPGMLNRQRFQLDMGSHPDRELQRDWNELGADAFEIGVLDELAPPNDASADVAADLDVLKDAWLEKLEASGQVLYPMSLRGR